MVVRGNAWPNYGLFRRTRRVFCFGGLSFFVSGSRVLKAWGHVRQLALFWDLHGWRVRTISADFCYFCGRCCRLQATKNASDCLFTVWICSNVVVGWLQLAEDSLVNMTVKCIDFTKGGDFFVARISTVSFSRRCQLYSIMNQIAFFCILLLQGARFVITKHYCVFRT